MPADRYRLEQLLAVRKHTTTRAEQALASCLRELERAREALSDSEQAHSAALYQARTALLGEPCAGASAEGSAHSGLQLRRKSAYAQRLQALARTRRSEHKAAQQNLRAAEQAVEQARKQYTHAEQQERLLNRDQERHLAAQRKRAERQELDEQQDALLARKR